jgi:hypothetical protein
VIEELAREYKGKVRFAKVNVDENQGTAEKFGIRAMPTFLLFKGGQVVGQLVGAQPKAKLNDFSYGRPSRARCRCRVRDSSSSACFCSCSIAPIRAKARIPSTQLTSTNDASDGLARV